MDGPAMSSTAVEALFRRTLRAAVALEGVSWTLDALQPPAQEILERNGLRLQAQHSLPLSVVAEHLNVPVSHAVAYVRTAGLPLEGQQRNIVQGVAEKEPAQRSPRGSQSSPRSPPASPDVGDETSSPAYG